MAKKHTRESRLVSKVEKQVAPRQTPIGTDIFIPNHSGNVKTPALAGDIANKEYVDTHAQTLEAPVNLTNADTDHGFFLNQTGVLATSKFGLFIYSNTAQSAGYLSRFNLDNASSDAVCLDVVQDGTGAACRLDMNGNGAALSIDSSASTANSVPISANSNTTGNVMRIDADANTSGNLLVLDTNSSSHTGSVLFVRVDHASASGKAVYIDHDGTGQALYIDSLGSGKAIYINHDSTTNRGIDMDSAVTNQQAVYIQGNSMTSGAVMYLSTNAAHSGTVLNLRNDSSTATGKCVNMQDDGTGISQNIDKNNAGTCIQLDADSNSATANYGIIFDLVNAGAGLEYAMRFNGSEIVSAAVGGSQDKKIRISIAGTDYFIPCHTA